MPLRIAKLLAASTIFVSIALIGCGKSQAAAASPPENAVSEDVSMAASIYAANLLERQSDLEVDGFTIQQPMSCTEAHAPSGSPSIVCRTVLTDSARNGGQALVDFIVFDQDVTFTYNDDLIKALIPHQEEGSVLNNDPNLTWEDMEGNPMKMGAACHQGLGAVNSPAYCGVLYSPRVFLYSAVKPAQPSTSEVKLNAAEGLGPDATQDVHHAMSLTLTALKIAAAADDAMP